MILPTSPRSIKDRAQPKIARETPRIAIPCELASTQVITPAAVDNRRWARTATYPTVVLKQKKKSAPMERRNRALSGVPEANGSRIAAGTARTYRNQSETEPARARPAQNWVATLLVGCDASRAMRYMARIRRERPGT